MNKLICVLLLFCACSLTHTESISLSHSEVEVMGSIHFYGDRYILKGVEKDYGKWFVLLESPILEKVNKELKLLSNYQVTGKVYTFNNTLYLLPIAFEATQKQDQKISKKKKKSKKTTSKKAKKSVSKKTTSKKTKKTASKKKKKAISKLPLIKLNDEVEVATGKITLKEEIKKENKIRKKIRISIEKKKGIFKKCKLQENLQYIKITSSGGTGCQIDIFAQLLEGKKKISFLANAKNIKTKVSFGNAKKFIASIALAKSEFKLKKISSMYIATAGFSGKAKEYLESFGVSCIDEALIKNIIK